MTVKAKQVEGLQTALSNAAYKNVANTFSELQSYSGTPTFSNDNHIVNKKYVDDLIDSSGGAFTTSSNITSNSPGLLSTDDFVFGSDSLDDDGDGTHDSRFFFDKSKSAFGAGIATGTEWNDTNRGNYSTRFGYNTTASGGLSFAIGFDTTASATQSFAGDFTIDFWIKFRETLGNQQRIVCQANNSTSYWELKFFASNGMDFRYVLSGTTRIAATEGTNVGRALNTWYHIALVRNGNNFTIYKNGVAVATTTDTDSMPSWNTYLGIAGHPNYTTQYAFGGDLDELRISKGIARRTSNFTPPTEPYN